MENELLLVPVILSIIKNYQEQAADVSKELKEAESALLIIKSEHNVMSDPYSKKLSEQVQELKSELAEKKALVDEFSNIYEGRHWLYKVDTDKTIH